MELGARHTSPRSPSLPLLHGARAQLQPRLSRVTCPSVLRVAMGDGRTDGGAESVEAHTAGRADGGQMAGERWKKREREGERCAARLEALLQLL